MLMDGRKVPVRQVGHTVANAVVMIGMVDLSEARRTKVVGERCRMTANANRPLRIHPEQYLPRTWSLVRCARPDTSTAALKAQHATSGSGCRHVEPGDVNREHWPANGSHVGSVSRLDTTSVGVASTRR